MASHQTTERQETAFIINEKYMQNLIQKAILKAMEVHQGQVRKGDGKTPYVLHPLEVGVILSHYTSSEVLIASAILHDVVEDGNVKIDDFKNEFNEDVASIVLVLTEDKTIQDWVQRKGEHLSRLANNKTAYIIKAVDALVNMRDLFTAVESQGDAVWGKFNAPKQLKMNYFERILDDLKTEMPSDLLKEYVSALKDLQYSHLIANNDSVIGFHK